MKNKILKIIMQAIPVLLMILFIPFVLNDYILTLIFVVIIFGSLYIKKEKNDILILVFGFVVMIIAEILFISTGVETFLRKSLCGMMPLWLPFLWAYSFVAIKRCVKILA